MNSVLDTGKFLLGALAGPIARWWKKSHPRVVEGLVVQDAAGLPPSYIFRYRPGRAPRDPGAKPERYAAWGKRHGGAYADKTLVTFVLSGQETTRIWNVRVVVTGRTSPLKGWIHRPPPMGGPITAHTITTSLDSADESGLTVVERSKPTDDGEDFESWNWPWSVSKDDPLALDLLVSAERGSYEWHVEIKHSTTGDKRRITKVPEHGTWISSSSDDCQPLEGSW